MPLRELTIIGMQRVHTVMMTMQAMKGMKSEMLSVMDVLRVSM